MFTTDLYNIIFFKKPSDSLPANLFLFEQNGETQQTHSHKTRWHFCGRVHADLHTWFTKAALKTEAERFNNLY